MCVTPHSIKKNWFKHTSYANALNTALKQHNLLKLVAVSFNVQATCVQCGVDPNSKSLSHKQPQSLGITKQADVLKKREQCYEARQLALLSKAAHKHLCATGLHTKAGEEQDPVCCNLGNNTIFGCRAVVLACKWFACLVSANIQTTRKARNGVVRTLGGCWFFVHASMVCQAVSMKKQRKTCCSHTTCCSAVL